MFFNDISLARYDIRRCHMIYLRCKYDIISVPFIREAYIICEADIIASAISSVSVGNGYHWKSLFGRSTKETFFMVRGMGRSFASQIFPAWRPFRTAHGARLRTCRLKNKDTTLSGDALFWCEEWDLNPHVVRHTHLKRACLPIPALSHIPADFASARDIIASRSAYVNRFL